MVKKKKKNMYFYINYIRVIFFVGVRLKVRFLGYFKVFVIYR